MALEEVAVSLLELVQVGVMNLGQEDQLEFEPAFIASELTYDTGNLLLVEVCSDQTHVLWIGIVR